MNYPILYSLQHCPYAMRARMGILLSEQVVHLRAIVLKNKPTEMLIASPKGTVPVLVIKNEAGSSSKVIDESLDVMLWALKQSDPTNLLYSHQPEMLDEMLNLISLFDTEFKSNLENYKSAKRYHDTNKVEHRESCEVYINQLEQRLSQSQYLMGKSLSLVDYAILPFIRRFAKIERQWYLSSPYPKLQKWLKSHLESPLFSKVMRKYPLWLENHEEVMFGKMNQ
ncbi:MAG: glutathione S-transferase [Kangiella sp.]|nr:MAG: glutathione S-transferase [Kangiella sp.]